MKFALYAVWRLALLVVATGLTGCVFHFGNAEKGVNQSLRKIFLPSITDNTSYGGQGGRLSLAIRQAFSLDTRFELVGLNEAWWALDIVVAETSWLPTKVAQCINGQGIVASGALDCRTLSFNQARNSLEEHAARIVVIANAIDLNSGAKFFTKRYELQSSSLPLIGDADTQANLRGSFSLQALRYLEGRDNAIEILAKDISDRILQDVLTLSYQPH